MRPGVLLAMCVLLIACDRSPSSARDAWPVTTLTGTAMGAPYQVKFRAESGAERLPDIRRRIESLLADTDRMFSIYATDSEILRLNRSAARTWVPVSPAVLEVLAVALKIGHESAGAYDIRIAPLVALWGLGPRRSLLSGQVVPTPGQIRQALMALKEGDLQWRDDPPAIRKRTATTEVDLNSVVPGWVADQAATILRQQGIADFLVDMGGELYAGGRAARGQPWVVAVETPQETGRAYLRTLHLQDEAISTSGSYRDYFELDGRRYSHLLDARTGHPVSHGIVSVTVVASSGLLADGWSTALLVLGWPEGKAVAERLGLAALFVEQTTSGWREHHTTAFEPYWRAS